MYDIKGKDVYQKRLMKVVHIFQSWYTLHKPVEGDALDEREHEQRTEEDDLWCINHGSRTTNKGFTTLSSGMFHGLSPL